ncbi:hypothetical protein DPMN_186042 [Dreissena polymorpha]|uniref:Uncharacterized protein n=1 Tax=Dreissena polymorpha TaxID=45954 RepID=A0A9D4DM14_DREPO|nr:hypothetical protein DPMN_186042 [Dreissena polymorpha]
MQALMDTAVPDPSGSPRIKNRNDPWPFWIFKRQRSSKDHHPYDNTASTWTNPAATRHQQGAHADCPGQSRRATDLHGKDWDKYGPTRHLNGPSRTYTTTTRRSIFCDSISMQSNLEGVTSYTYLTRQNATYKESYCQSEPSCFQKILTSSKLLPIENSSSKENQARGPD